MSKNDSKEKLKKEDKVKEENFLDEKKTKKDVNKKYGEKTMLSKIINIVLWVILIAWMAVCLFDFYRTNQEKSPVFCISKNETKYDDGSVKWCLGLGYKVYNYNRESFKAIEFGPFWSKDRSVEENN